MTTALEALGFEAIGGAKTGLHLRFDDVPATGIAEGLAEQKVVAGTLIAYATQPGHVAYDGDGANGFFTEALLAHIATPGREVDLMLRDVRAEVFAATETKSRGPQVPWVHSSLMNNRSGSLRSADRIRAQSNFRSRSIGVRLARQ